MSTTKRRIRDFDKVEKLDRDSLMKLVASLIKERDRDRIEKKRFEKESHTDELTGVGNLRELRRNIGRLAKYHKDTFLTLMVFDLDCFKHINDRFGHPNGDKVLIKVVRTIEKCVRPFDKICRTGGDEFTILGEPRDVRRGDVVQARDIQNALQRMRRRVAELVWPIDGLDKVTISSGAAVGRYSDFFSEYSDENAKEFLDRLRADADKALYLAKRGVGNRVADSVEL